MRRLLRIATAGLVFVSVWLLWPREMDSVVSARQGVRTVPSYVLANARYTSSREGEREVEAFAEQARVELAARQMHSESITIYQYSANARKVKVTADRGTQFMDERRFQLERNVLSEALDSGFFLKSEKANYLIGPRKLDVPVPLEGWMKDDSLRLWGDRGEGWIDRDEVWVYGNARTRHLDPRRGETRLRGDEAQLLRNDERVNFFKNVRVEQGGVTGTGAEANLFYHQARGAQGQVSYLSLRTDVKIQDERKRYTRSQLAEFYAPTDTIVLSGFPALYDGDDAVTGDRITLYRATGVVEVTGTNAVGGGQHVIDGAREPELTEEDKELLIENETSQSGKPGKKL
ncbi:MAG: LPS export ABC transporter periplasmic protein LptC [Bdellovibrionales bacterium]|nr:LPS export ABC transporter periplasmic protein LptC [Bdellovibrionales bacterium]